MSDGLENVSDALEARDREGVQRFCFYHFQDVEGALAGRGLYLAFGVFRDDSVAAAEVGHMVRGILESHGFGVEWDGSDKTRLLIPSIDWKRRLRG